MKPETAFKLRQIGLRAASSLETVFASYGVARMAIEQGIPGDFVECGVFCGAQSAAMALAIVDEGAIDRRVHLFDSFQGVEAAGPEDHTWRKEHGDKAGISAQTLEQVQAHMKEWGIPEIVLDYHPGWFEHSLHLDAFKIPQVAVLRVDCDLYEPTLATLSAFHQRVVPGGWIIADDYGLEGARKAVNHFLGVEPIYWRRPR